MNKNYFKSYKQLNYVESLCNKVVRFSLAVEDTGTYPRFNVLIDAANSTEDIKKELELMFHQNLIIDEMAYIEARSVSKDGYHDLVIHTNLLLFTRDEIKRMLTVILAVCTRYSLAASIDKIRLAQNISAPYPNEVVNNHSQYIC